MSATTLGSGVCFKFFGFLFLLFINSKKRKDLNCVIFFFFPFLPPQNCFHAGVVSLAFTPSTTTQEVEPGESLSLRQPGLHSEFQNCQNYIEKPCSKKNYPSTREQRQAISVFEAALSTY